MSPADHDQPESSTPGRPWASGRVLSTEQRERKRQANRNSNRFLRSDLQNRMKALENRVIELETWRSQFNVQPPLVGAGAHSRPYNVDGTHGTVEGGPQGRIQVLTNKQAHQDTEPWPVGTTGTAGDNSTGKTSAQSSPRLQTGLFDSQVMAEGFPVDPENFRQSSNWPVNQPNQAFGAPAGQPQPLGNTLNLPLSHNGTEIPGYPGDVNPQEQNLHNDPGTLPNYATSNVNSLPDHMSLTMNDSSASPSISNLDATAWGVEGIEQPGRWLPSNPAQPVQSPSSVTSDLNSSAFEIISTPEVVPFVPLQNLHGREITDVCNILVQYVRNLSPDAVCLNDTYNQDVIIRAVLHGWDHAFSRYPIVCPLWRVIRYVDYQLFRRCNINERICVLRILQTMYSYEVLRNAKVLPPWYKPRPSQQCIEHEPVVDHLAWPGLRERLSIAENNTLTNRFWYEFGHNFRFIWPHSPLEAFHLRPGTSCYQISADFASSMQDIGRYRMRSDFFVQFPLLYDDIGAAEYLPLLWARPTETYTQRRLEDAEQGEAEDQGVR